LCGVDGTFQNALAYFPTATSSARKMYIKVTPGLCAKTQFTASLTPYHNKLAFVTVGRFHPCLIFVGVAEHVRVETIARLHSKSMLLYQKWIEVTDSSEHSSLLQFGIDWVC